MLAITDQIPGRERLGGGGAYGLKTRVSLAGAALEFSSSISQISWLSRAGVPC